MTLGERFGTDAGASWRNHVPSFARRPSCLSNATNTRPQNFLRNKALPHSLFEGIHQGFVAPPLLPLGGVHPFV